MLDDGAAVLFHGHLANQRQIGRELDCALDDLAALYGRALERWGDDTDRRLIGEYCAILFDTPRRRLRLARSPLRAPPLFYHHGEQLLAAASVPRVLFAAGAPRCLDRSHLLDSFNLDFSGEEQSYFIDIARVPLGSVVEIEFGRPRRLTRFYDLLALPKSGRLSDADIFERGSRLLDQAVAVALEGAKRPGATLSGGLDSSQVATRVLGLLPPEQRLPTFTFLPEAGWDGIVAAGKFGDDGPWVRQFAAMHPRIDPHFCDNAGIAHDHGWSRMFHAMDGAPSGLCNMYLMHGVWSAARGQGCDRLLLADWGNVTFSAPGDWGFVEYLLTGRWRQLARALRAHPFDSRPLLRRFVSLSLIPLLPDSIWRRLMRRLHPSQSAPLDLISPLRRGIANDRASSRFQPRSRRHALALLFANADSETSETLQAFEQIYGVEQRDPLAYRPWVEFCLGLPTDMFLRDGEPRWLARQLARGRLPEEQRLNPLDGRWDSDWHLRIGRQRSEWLRELDRIAADPELAAMIDAPRLRAALSDYPESTVTDPEQWMPLEMAVPRAILAARFFRFAEGRND